MAAFLIGLDIGTSSTKALLVDESGMVVAQSQPEYPFVTPKPLWSESDPNDWWKATIFAIKDLLTQANLGPGSVAGIGLSGQMHGLVLLDKEGEVLRPAILWNDQRTGRECREMTDLIGSKTVLSITGNPVLPGFTAPKLLWVRNNEPEIYSKIAHVLLPKDFIRYKLTGEFYSEVSDASGTAFLDVGKRQWSGDILKTIEVPRKWLPEVTESIEVSSHVSPTAAQFTGLAAGTPVVGGGGDQAAQAVGCGVIREGLISATLGTSGVVFAQSDSFRVEEEGRLHAFCHAVPGKWHLMGVMLSAAGSFQWYRDAIARDTLERERSGEGNAYDLLTKEAATISPGSDGLLFLPYLSGERTPHPDPYARGTFFGLSLRHRRAHMTRAVLEGVTFGLRDSLELMRGLGIQSDSILASGGGSRSPFWRQLLADIFESPVVRPAQSEGAAFGAALLAGVGTSVYPDLDTACEKTLKFIEGEKPSEDSKVYKEFYDCYSALYPALKNQFKQLAEVVERNC